MPEPTIPATVTHVACPICGRVGYDDGQHGNGLTGEPCRGRPHTYIYTLSGVSERPPMAQEGNDARS